MELCISIPGHIEQKKKKRINQIHMSFLLSVMIKNAYKNYNFSVCPNFSTSFVIVPIFFPENFFTTKRTKQKKKELCVSITKKHFQFFPYFPIFQFSNFPGNFSIFFFFLNHPCIKANKRKK
jgi:hypothetical protein